MSIVIKYNELYSLQKLERKKNIIISHFCQEKHSVSDAN
jgi:hypothetical protein